MSEKPKNHVCLVCGYATNQPTHMKKHLSRIMPCGDVTTDDPNYKKMIDIYINGIKPPKEEKEHRCQFCNKQFKCRTSIYKHAKICTGKAKVEDKIKVLEDKVRKLEEEPKIIQNITNNNGCVTNNIIIDTVNVNNFGSEKLDHLTSKQELLDQCVRRRDKGHGEFIEYVYYRTPENRNVMTSKCRNMVRVLENNEWFHRDKDDIEEEMIQSTGTVLTDHFEMHKRRFKKDMSDCLFYDVMKYLNQVNAGNLDIRLKLKSKVEEIVEMITKANHKR